MDDLAEGVAQFQRDVFSRKADLFAHLAATHTPSTLFIGCSDARVVPELITSSEPGELFVIRTAGNLVPAYRQGADGWRPVSSTRWRCSECDGSWSAGIRRAVR